MASVTGFHSTTTDDVFIPQMYSKLVLVNQKANLVSKEVFENRSGDVEFGSAVDFPIVSVISPTSWTQGARLSDSLTANTEDKKTITIDQEYVAPQLVTRRAKKQSMYDTVALFAKESSYAVDKQMDTEILSKSSSFTNSAVGTAGAAITNIILTSAMQALDVANVPSTERAWLFDPRTMKDLFDLTGNYFTSMDFSMNKALSDKKLTMILGSPVYVTTNLPTGSTGSPATTYRKNLYVHKQAIGFATQENISAESEYNLDLQGWLLNARALWGSAVLRGDYGVIVNGR